MEWTVAIGVDTHKEAHVAVALDALGAQLDSHEISAMPAGYHRRGDMGRYRLRQDSPISSSGGLCEGEHLILDLGRGS
jgi:hypothetical protein